MFNHKFESLKGQQGALSDVVWTMFAGIAETEFFTDSDRYSTHNNQ